MLISAIPDKDTMSPAPASSTFYEVQDAYLSQRAIKKGITKIDDLKPVETDERLYLWQGDITTLACDAIINAANNQMTGCYRPLHNSSYTQRLVSCAMKQQFSLTFFNYRIGTILSYFSNEIKIQSKR